MRVSRTYHRIPTPIQTRGRRYCLPSRVQPSATHSHEYAHARKAATVDVPNSGSLSNIVSRLLLTDASSGYNSATSSALFRATQHSLVTRVGCMILLGIGRHSLFRGTRGRLETVLCLFYRFLLLHYCISASPRYHYLTVYLDLNVGMDK